MDDPSLQSLPSVDEAVAILDATAIEPIITIDVDLARLEEQLTSNVLACDVRADRDYPPFDKSIVDGFAVRAADVSQPGAELSLLAEIPAGSTSSREVGPGEAAPIMTGAPMPPGADAVVMVEHSTLLPGDRVRFDRPARPGGPIARRGSDATAGRLLLPKGTLIGPAQLAVLASVGALRVPVVGDPIAHVLVTGDEIVAAGEVPTGSQIRDGSGPALVSMLRHFGALPGLSHVDDRRESVRTAIEQIASEADVLLVSGGMSMGRHDHVPAVLRELGFELKITKLRIKPGKPFVFAVRERPGKTDIVLGLPGNPVSSFVCALRLASRVIARLRGLTPRDDWRWVRLATDVGANGDREFYQPATVDPDGAATPLRWNGSADVFTLALADVLIVRPENDGPRAAGELVRALAIPR
jgi:molybdopterin molybdotransferase